MATSDLTPPRLDRRTVLKWMLAASGAAALDWPRLDAAPAPAAQGYGTDPDLTRLYKPGDLWPLTLTAAQRRTVTALCDVILPADERSPAASAVGVPEFLDEWISAPYPQPRADRELLLRGLAWLETEAARRHGREFAQLELAAQRALCDELSGEKPGARPANLASCFRRFRDLTVGAYFTSETGMKVLGYTGNVALTDFEGPPPDVLQRLGL